ncbi:MAG: polysaccharide biosynthesis tyrosine autokinase [Armatimonadetes bacterium]|nr:polysaccharide biosynthesis tyrosine autokinase [Armatimonadota bacterium]MDE2205563.1 polysaccharide biosynthesis tyrosine autokinase [Armatimonadota bacterium]
MRRPQNGAVSTGPVSTPQSISTPQTDAALIASAGMGRRTLDYIKNGASQGGPPFAAYGPQSEEMFLARFTSDIHVRRHADSDLVAVSWDADTPHHAVMVANAVCRAFVLWSNQIAGKGVQEVADSLNLRAQRARQQMEDANNRLAEFRKSQHIIDLTAQQQQAVTEYGARDSAVAQAKQALIGEQAHLKAVAGQLKNVDAAIRNGTGVRDDSLVQQLQVQLNQAEAERSAAAQKFTPAYPGILPNMDARIADLKSRINDAVRSTLNNKMPSLQSQASLVNDYESSQVQCQFLAANLATAVAQRTSYSRQIASLPQTTVREMALEHDAAMDSAVYMGLETSLNNTRIQGGLSSGAVQIASSAQAGSAPVQPDWPRNMTAGALAGILLSLMTVGVAGQYDRRIRSLEAARRLVSGPVIGAMPALPSPLNLLASRATSAAITTEAFTLARANLALAAPEMAGTSPGIQQVILITSALPREGKSVAAAELARSYARAGNRTLLVDADMRCPVQAVRFGVTPGQGLAEALIGKADLDRVILPTNVHGLSLLQAGIPACNPAEMIAQLPLTQVFTRLRDRADKIVVDTPACATVADALMLAPYADCVVQVIGVGEVEPEFVRDASAALRAAAGNRLCFMMNRVPRDHAQKDRARYAWRRPGDATEVSVLAAGAPRPRLPSADGADLNTSGYSRMDERSHDEELGD